MRTDLLLASTVLLSACATTADDRDLDAVDGKLDGYTLPRTVTLTVDRRPADGPLVEVHIVPRGMYQSQISVEYTTRSRRGESHRSEVLIDNGECAVALDAIECNEDPTFGDLLFEAVRTADGWTVTTTTGSDTATIGTAMEATHVRFSRHVTHPEGAAELTLDVGTQGQVVTVRRPATPDEELPSEVETVMTAGACKLGGDVLTCVEDERTSDGSLKELTLKQIVPGGPYRATLRTSSQRLDGEVRETTKVLADELVLR